MSSANHSTPDRSAIVGLGAVTGYGWGVDPLVAGIREGRTAAVRAEVDATKVVASVVPDPGGELLHPHERYSRAAFAAVAEALTDARRRGWEAGPCVGVLFCTGVADIRGIRDRFLRDDGRVRPREFASFLHTSMGSLLAQEHGWTGPNSVVNAACSSGAVALLMADAWLRAGIVSDVVIAGAEFLLIDEIIAGFRSMRVLLGEHHDITECRPFQEGSRGFFLGEAAAAIVVSGRADHPRATYLGGATTHDAFHVAASEPEGRELERCHREGLERAGVRPEEVALVKAHGSGTRLNDGIELALSDRLYGPDTLLCSYKPLLGHCMAMSALVEVAAVLAGRQAGVLPRRVTDDPADRRLADGQPVPDGPTVCVSVGLGGANAVAVLDIHPPFEPER